MYKKSTEAPLQGLRIIEFTGIGPGPFAAMMLADMGAEIIRIDRQGGDPENDHLDFMARGRRSISLDLKTSAGTEVALRLVKEADGLIEGFRPGVMERLGLGPEVCRALNERLVYGRMTGWGQTGPLAKTAGHDLNYIALTGALWASGESQRPPAFALNLLGDFGGGGMMLAYGMLAGFIRAARTGCGDVIDAAICDGTSTLMTMTHSMRAMQSWRDERCSNLLDGGVPWYAVYHCADGEWITIAALEPKFWNTLLDKLELKATDLGDREDPQNWPKIKSCFEALFNTQPRDYWEAKLAGTDACFAPVLSPAEAHSHPHVAARNSFAPGGPDQPMPAPRFADAETPLPARPCTSGEHSRTILEQAGYSAAVIDSLVADGIVQCTETSN